MLGPKHITEPAIVLPVFFAVCVLAIILLLTVKLPDLPMTDKRISKGHYSKDFDKGSFMPDFVILFLIALPFIIVYFLIQ